MTMDDDRGHMSAREQSFGIAHSTNDVSKNDSKDGGTNRTVDISSRGAKARATLRARLGEDVYTSWFGSLECDTLEDGVLRVSVPQKFLKNWIQTHYTEQLLACMKLEFPEINRVDVLLRQPVGVAQRVNPVKMMNARRDYADDANGSNNQTAADRRPSYPPLQAPMVTSRTSVDGFEGSPLDPRCTFDTFVVGPANRMAHAGAHQVAETVFADDRGFNPLFLHSSVGLGKSHLLHAIAWEVKRRTPNAKVLYMTAERFRFQFVEAIKTQDATAFKDKFRSIDILLIDDLEFMQGEKTEQEFEHIVNALLDGGRQVVVASARAPAQLERMNDRMRSRLQRGLVTEISALDHDMRIKILEKRVQDRRAGDPLFEVQRDVLEMIADRLTENGRELEGAITRLYATWQLLRQPIALDMADAIIRDLVQGVEPRRIKIDDILRIISRHYAVSKADILSQRRHRSVVWPRQIGMYLAKQLTARSLPEIGRRFGDRDHTTVLHAIRKIDKELAANTRLRDELEELKKQLNR
jgi:chromosomal replication initiator protein